MSIPATYTPIALLDSSTFGSKKITWVDGKSGNTPLSAENLNKVEARLDEISNTLYPRVNRLIKRSNIVFNSFEEARDHAASANSEAYIGQRLVVVDANGIVTNYQIIDASGTLRADNETVNIVTSLAVVNKSDADEKSQLTSRSLKIGSSELTSDHLKIGNATLTKEQFEKLVNYINTIELL